VRLVPAGAHRDGPGPAGGPRRGQRRPQQVGEGEVADGELGLPPGTDPGQSICHDCQVIHQYVQPTIGGQEPFGEPADAVEVGEVQGVELDPVDPGGLLPGMDRAASRDDDGGSGGAESPDGSKPDPGVAPGHDGGGPGEVHIGLDLGRSTGTADAAEDGVLCRSLDRHANGGHAPGDDPPHRLRVRLSPPDAPTAAYVMAPATETHDPIEPVTELDPVSGWLGSRDGEPGSVLRRFGSARSRGADIPRRPGGAAARELLPAGRWAETLSGRPGCQPVCWTAEQRTASLTPSAGAG
jgi:hypothetical protein